MSVRAECVVAIHQPEAFPWLGFFDKMFHSDVFVLLDNVQFEKNYYQNRNRIRTTDGWAWITIPVLTKGRSSQTIDQVVINNAMNWRRKIKVSLEQSYRQSAHWDRYRDELWGILDRSWTHLTELNCVIIPWLAEALGIRRSLVRASALGVAGKRSALLLDVCRSLGATKYLSGVSGRSYLDSSVFVQAGIGVLFQEFHHPIYHQRHQPFIPCMSALDLLFAQGPDALDCLIGAGTPRLTEVFR